ncbi:MAG TPA: NAD(P)/FAD-dependent oxidoreductase [Pseudolabrys sp.]|nr:NAD(P)/FAD-dependent oxidoreductase [Pseudolabrys sp.]
MPISEFETVIVGGGAAGIAAAHRLHRAGVDCLIVEARARLGGRAWTVAGPLGSALDLGCGWLHSADRNPWVAVAEEQGHTIDKTPPPWRRRSSSLGFTEDSQREFLKAQEDFFARVSERAQKEPDVPAAALMAPGCRWNDLINAVGTYISGAELDRVSARDFDNFDDTGVNWRVAEGYGATIAACGEKLPTALDCPVLRIDHNGKRLKIETQQGVITADQAIVTMPSAILAEADSLFSPMLPDKTQAAQGLPLGLADKLFLSLENAEEFEKDSRLFGATDRTATATYHLRPFGRPQIEVFFGGTLAAELEQEGERAFFDFAVSELMGLLGNAFLQRVKPIHIHRWAADPFARGSYSYALPGMADCRAKLAASVDNRLFFAGEACSPGDFSTAHGGWITGVIAADQALSARSLVEKRNKA